MYPKRCIFVPVKREVKTIQTPSVSGIQDAASAGGYGMHRGLTFSGQHLVVLRQPSRLMEGRIVRVLEGTADYCVNLLNFHLTAGAILVLPPGSIIELREVGADFRIQILMSKTDATDDVLHLSPPEEDLQEFDGIARSIWNALHLEPVPEEFVRLQYLSYVAKAKYLARFTPKGDGNLRGEDILRRFLDVIHESGGAKKTMAFYAERLSLTPHYLSALIKEVSGRNAMEWVNQASIQQAKLLLMQGQTAQQVADALDFPSPQYFSRFFKRETGQTPGQYVSSMAVESRNNTT